MKRIKEDFLQKVEKIVPLKNLAALEIGCGRGGHSIHLAAKVRSLEAIDPDPDSVAYAELHNARSNIRYYHAWAEQLPFDQNKFDLSVFTLSLHHIPIEKMAVAISESVRVTKNSGWVIFLEPGVEGSFFEFEILFDAGDGDERTAKTAAHLAMFQDRRLIAIAEIPDETIFQFSSIEDVLENLPPRKNIGGISPFFPSHHFLLTAERRINIFQVVK